MPKVKKKSSAISTIWNARDHIKFVQNKLGGLVGTLESAKVIDATVLPCSQFSLD